MEKLKWSKPILTDLGGTQLMTSGAQCGTGASAGAACGTGSNIATFACNSGYSPYATYCNGGSGYDD